jgi:hypothetical protein
LTERREHSVYRFLPYSIYFAGGRVLRWDRKESNQYPCSLVGFSSNIFFDIADAKVKWPRCLVAGEVGKMGLI